MLKKVDINNIMQMKESNNRRRKMQKTLKMTIILCILIIAMKVYSYVYIDVSKKQQQLFINYLVSHIAQIQEFYFPSSDGEKQIQSIELQIDKNENENWDLHLLFDEQKAETLIKKYGAKFIEILKENPCTVDEFIEVELNGEIQLADKFKLTANEKQFMSRITSLMKEILEDSEVLNLCEGIVSKEQIQRLKKANEAYIKKIDEIDEDSRVNIAVYVKDGKPVRTDFFSSNDEFSYQSRHEEKENLLKFSIKHNNKQEKFVLTSEVSTENHIKLILTSDELYMTCDARIDEEIKTEI